MTTLRTHGRFLLFLLVVCLGVAGLTAWSVWQARTDALERAALTAENLAGVLNQHAARAVEAVDLALGVVESRLQAEGLPHPYPGRVHRSLRERLAATPLIQALLVFDQNGKLLYESGSHPARLLHLDQPPQFRVERPGNGTLGISLPSAPPDASPGTLALSRRIERAGSFTGTVVALVGLGHFQRFYDGVELGPRSTIGLFALDGTLLVREPLDPAAQGTRFADMPLFRDWLPQRPSGAFASRSPVDGVARQHSWRRVDGLPFVVLVSIADGDALAHWRGDLLRQTALGLLLIVVLVAAGLFLWRQVRSRLSAEGRAATALVDLEHKHAVIETILRTLPDGVCLYDRHLRLAGCNDQLFRIFRLGRNAILDAPNPAAAFCRALAERGDLGGGDLDAAIDRMQRAVRMPGRYHRRLADGRVIECRHTPVGGLGYLAVYRDVTEETNREAALRKAYRQAEEQTQAVAAAAAELRRARAAAEHANLTKSRFLAGMSHELRTPLNAIIGFSEIISGLYLGRDAIEKYREYARDIQASGQHLLALINDVLDLSKIEAGRMELWEGTVDLDNTVYSALKMVEPRADGKGVALHFESAGRPVLLRADAQKLLQSVLNVLSNAVKFTSAGGRVTATVASGTEGVAVIVADTGIGIAPADLERMFEPFTQIDSSVARENVGTGLGMSLTRSMIELHGGSIAVESAEGAGTTVTLRLPRDRILALQPLAKTA